MIFIILYSTIQWNNENILFKNIRYSSWYTTKNKGDTAFVRSSTKHIYDMMNSRREQFKDQYFMSLEQRFFRSVDVDLKYGGGACGGYSKVLARHLQLAGFKVRVAQLKVPVVGYGGHNVVEYFSKTLNKWILIDPLFNMFIFSKDGKPGNVQEIINNWNYYSKQMTKDYSLKFKFLGVRYTNWDKLGILSNSTYKTICFMKGKEYADSVALKTYFLSMYKLVSLFSLCLYGLFILLKYVFPQLRINRNHVSFFNENKRANSIS